VYSGLTSSSSYLAFRGIPYAAPPVGELRFRAPLPHPGWSGVRDASKFGDICVTNGFMGLMAGGKEDCLFVNVYTTDVNANRPVMFWIYGGAFILGDGNKLLYGPDQLMKEDIVVVTMNYRLSSFGFLSTGDKHAQGNYAIKDMVMALKWVQANIKNFGGDPSKVTIAGQSAGSVSVHTLLLSEQTKDLFHQVIMMSGSVLFPFSYQTNPRAKVENLAKKIGLTFNSTEDMMQQLRSVSYKDIIKHDRGIDNQDDPMGSVPFDFVITVEPEDSIDERFVTEPPESTLLRGEFRRVPTLVGSMSKEGLFNLVKTMIDPTFLAQYNVHPEYFVPLSYNIPKNDTNSITEVADVVKNIYFHNRKLSSETKDEFATFITDSGFKFGVDRAVKFMASTSAPQPIYYYEFTYDGALNMIKTIMFLKSYSGACHADDLFYLFTPSFPMLAWPNDHAYTVKHRVVRMWSNFIKTG
jgi:bile salt-stimulated lipase